MEDKKATVKLSRRDFLKLGAQGAAVMALFASCGPQPAAEEAPGKPAAKEELTLRYLGWPDTSDIPAWEKLKEMYEERNPNVTIDITLAPGGEHYTKMQTMIAGGTPPHVAGFQGREFQPFAVKGALAAIDDYISADKFTSPFPEGVDTIEVSTKRKGKRYLIPMQMGTMLMFYARKPFDEAGIPYPKEDWTFEEFLETAEKLTDTSGSFKKFGLQANGIWPRDIHYIRSTGKQEFDTIVDPHKAQFAQPEIIEVIQIMSYDVYHKLKISPTAADLEGGANAFDTGNCAMKYEGPWWFPKMTGPDLKEQGKEIPFDVVLMPKMQDASRPHRGWSEGICVMKSDKQDATWDFVKFMAGEEGDKIYAEITGRIPNSFDLIESFWAPMVKERFGVENGLQFMESFKRSEVDVIGGISRGQFWSEVVKPVGWDPMLNGSATAAEVLPKVDEGVQKMLDEYWAEQG